MRWGDILILLGPAWMIIAFYYLLTGNYSAGVLPNFHGWMIVVGAAITLVGLVLKRKGR